MINFKSALFTYKKDEYLTPQWLYDELNNEFHFMTDPCTTAENPLKTHCFYTKKDDGLTKPWIGPVYINPPYGKEVESWIKKAIEYNESTGNDVVMLLPSRTDTRWFHEYVWNKPNIRIKFIRGRLKFGGSDKPNTAPFPSILVIIERSCKR